MSADLQPMFDWKNPQYARIWAQRAVRLRWLRARTDALPGLRSYYAEHLADFVCDFGVTADPRLALLHPPRDVLMPFLLFPKQRAWVDWVLELARAKEAGVTEKSRDCGISWLAMATAVSLCLFNRGMVIGVGSAKEDKIDRTGDPDCLFWKARTFLKHLPPEFRGSWDETRHTAHMRIQFPETGSAIVGEAGDSIGRGGRSSIYFVDEAAHLERPHLIEASLASNTDCRVDISSVSGLANPFAEKRHSGRVKVFTFSWRDDPRKGEAWYAEQQRKLDPVTLASEIDIDYRASTEGALIPMIWVQSAVGALERLSIEPSGARCAALDIADEGRDRNAFAARHGQRLAFLASWSGKSRDIFSSVQQCFLYCDQLGYRSFRYDGDGMGAGVRGDARVVNGQRKSQGLHWVDDVVYRGSAAPLDPDGEMTPGRKNKDFFANLKSQSWWSLRQRFQATHRAVAEGGEFDPDELISIAPDLDELQQLLQELAQPTYSINNAGKIVIDKAPAGFKSPNLADAVCIAFAPTNFGSFFPESAFLVSV
jgi:phage terminase large subunit